MWQLAAASQAILLVDLNIPGGRHALVMPKLAMACGNCCKVAGADKSILLIHCPSRAKEESGGDPMADEMEFCELLRKQGFNNIRWFQMLEVPAEEPLSKEALLFNDSRS